LAPPWKKGQSGNPNGRPKKAVNIAKLAEESSEAALKKMVKLINSDDDRVALAAAQAVLDRAVGKPKQPVETNPKRENSDYSEQELLAIARVGSQRADPTEEGAGKHRQLQ
jgi:hypothetical protein